MKNLFNGCIAAGVLGVWAVACSGAPDTQTAGTGNGTQQFADEDQEATSINQALHQNPKDPVALKRAAEFNERNDKLAGLVQTVDVGEGRLVQFYQQASGQRALSVEGKLGMPELELKADGRSFEEVYRDLKPGLTVPKAILDADSRHKEQMLEQAAERAVMPEAPATDIRAVESVSNGRAVVTSDPVSPAIAEGSQIIEKRMSCDEFMTQWCFAGGDSNFCHCYTTQDLDEVRTKVLISYSAVAVPYGTVTVKVTAGSVTAFRQIMFQDDAKKIWAWEDSCGTAGCVPKAVTHTQSIWGIDPDERVHRGMCSERTNGPPCRSL